MRIFKIFYYKNVDISIYKALYRPVQKTIGQFSYKCTIVLSNFYNTYTEIAKVLFKMYIAFKEISFQFRVKL